ncbi:unnamed protein product [Miscanthus lutarioriparius]|uniref:Uncharacterized protein n=1 Tax=Miscanthus lutarioriparius TaxID=422564 RepID=A0A811MUA6_9POAL|nr:unnamed protein product [Miscanthus lutarioriparius]
MKKMMAGIELSAADATVAEKLNTAKMRAYPIKKSYWQQEDGANCLAIEEEDVGVDPLVEGCLGYHEQASVDQLYDDGEAIRLHTCFHNLRVTTK